LLLELPFQGGQLALEALLIKAGGIIGQRDFKMSTHKKKEALRPILTVDKRQSFVFVGRSRSAQWEKIQN